MSRNFAPEADRFRDGAGCAGSASAGCLVEEVEEASAIVGRGSSTIIHCMEWFL